MAEIGDSAPPILMIYGNHLYGVSPALGIYPQNLCHVRALNESI